MKTKTENKKKTKKHKYIKHRHRSRWLAHKQGKQRLTSKIKAQICWMCPIRNSVKRRPSSIALRN